ncbi:MAG: DUF1080 domain-containing protein [Planctomycetia bacterium]|nr:DUF1080 domain-containing protein [Planctomycetia bacterium]
MTSKPVGMKRIWYKLFSVAILLIVNGMNNFAEETELERIAKVPFVPAVSGTAQLPGLSLFGGSWSIKDGILTGKGGAGPLAVPNMIKPTTAGEFQAELLLPNNANGFSGISFKVSDCKPGADNFNGYEIGFNPNGQLIMFGTHRYNYQTIRQVPCEIPKGKWFKARVRFDETSFEFFLNDKSIFQYTEKEMAAADPLRKGTIALRTWQYDLSARNLKFRDSAANEKGWTEISMTEEAVPVPETEYPETLETKDLPPLLVLLRSPLTPPNSVGNDIWQAQPTFPGCEIRLVTPANPKEAVRTIFRDPDGCIYDMNLSYDAKTIYFSYRPKDVRYWHIYKIGVDGSGLTQLTSGDYYDIGPSEMPDGRIVFVSTRRFGHTVCQPGPASNLFTMDADGNNIRCVSMNTLSDFSPQVLPDGRVLFTRWEYVDRDLTYRQSLWTQNPDGSQYQLYFGNTVRDVGSFLQARPLPDSGSSRVVATFAPHHNYPHGAIGLVDRRFGVEGKKNESWQYITKEFPVIGDRAFPWSYRDPYPLTDSLFLCSFGSEGPTIYSPEEGGAKGPRFRIWLLDSAGEKRMLYEDKKLSCFFPIPFEERDRPALPASRIANVNLKKVLRPNLVKEQVRPVREETWGIPEYGNMLQGEPVGVVILTDVYNGMEGINIPKGTIKTLRIMEQVRKSEDLMKRAFDQSPVMSCGTYYAKRCWGEVPVEEDGSAHFYVPALREIYFQALDEQGREIQRMTSAAQFMPGETTSCLGCHEPRDTLPGTAMAAARAKAVSRKPTTPSLPDWMVQAAAKRDNQTLDAGIIDYVSTVQPVLDRYCVKCHDGPNPDGGYNLSGDKTRFFNMSYDNLIGRSRSYRQCNMLTGELIPDQAARGKPLVQFHWLLYTPSAVNRPYASGSMASRLPDCFTKEHCKQEVDAESMARLRMWIDADIPYYGTYANRKPGAAGKRDRWAGPQGYGPAPWFAQGITPVYDRACAACHKNIFGGNRDIPGVRDGRNIDWIGRFAWIDLTRPENSPLLTAHLNKKAGGRGLPIDPKQPEKMLFNDTNHPDYQTMLKAIQKGCQESGALPEADMPGFKNARPEP